MLTPYKHQTEVSNQALPILKNYGIVYLAMEERTGKTLTSILICEQTLANKILVVTKKKALKGWQETLSNYECKKQYVVINYESLHKLESTNFDLVIVDEAHYCLGAYPKPSQTFHKLRAICYDLPVIYLSATPNAESCSQLYHQFAITKYSPFRSYSNFYNWFRAFGIQETMWVNGRSITLYKNVQVAKVDKCVEHLFISMTRKQIGFQKEPQDNKVYVQLKDSTIAMLEKALAKKVLHFQDETYVIDSVLKEMYTLAQIEGGTLKLSSKKSINLGNTEKIDYILKEYGDKASIAIMYNFVAEKALLQHYFKNALLLQATAFAEGVDLSHIEKLVIYSMNFSASKFIQRRARQCSINRKEPIVVDFLLVEGGISELAYKAITEKKMGLTERYYKSNKTYY